MPSQKVKDIIGGFGLILATVGVILATVYSIYEKEEKTQIGENKFRIEKVKNINILYASAIFFFPGVFMVIIAISR